MAHIRLAQFTIFDTPVLKTLLRFASLMYLKAFGWKLEGEAPGQRKYVIIAAPHTSNWDLPMTLAVVFAYRLKIFFLAKHTLFAPPFGSFMRWLGGIPVDRTSAHNFVDQAVDLFNTHDDLVLLVPPEGTRKQVRYWKSGFYHIAHGAGVPIALGYMDFKRKVAGIGGMWEPSGDFDTEIVTIRRFYAGITGKNPAWTGVIED